MKITIAYNIRQDTLRDLILKAVLANQEPISQGGLIAGQGWKMLPDWPFNESDIDLWVQIEELILEKNVFTTSRIRVIDVEAEIVEKTEIVEIKENE